MSDPALDRIRHLFHQLDDSKRHLPEQVAIFAETAAAAAAWLVAHPDDWQLVSANAPPDEDDRTPRRLHRTREPITPFDPPSYAGRLRMAKANLPW